MSNENGTIKLGELVIRAPGPNDGGHLRRVLLVTEIIEGHLNPGETAVGKFHKFVDMFMPFIVVPKDRNKAREALLDASKQDYQRFQSILLGSEADVPLGSGTDSETP